MKQINPKIVNGKMFGNPNIPFGNNENPSGNLISHTKNAARDNQEMRKGAMNPAVL